MSINSKIVVYQVFPRWFTNDNPVSVFNGSIQENGVGKINDINQRVLNALHDLGVSHIWYTGIIRNAKATSTSQTSKKAYVKGNAGSPYAIQDYYDIDPDIATCQAQRMQEFEALVARTHAAGMKVIIDFVPNHVAREYHSTAKPANVEDLGATDDKGMFFSPTNNFYYITGEKFAPTFNIGDYEEFPAKATGNDCYHAHPGVNDWYETVKLNYGVDPWNGSTHFDPIPPTWTKMLHILTFWASKGVDGFRCDMVHMVPTAFWHWAIAQVKTQFPSMIFIAELYDVNLYREYLNYGGFDYLYDKVNLYDTLIGIIKNDIPASQITQCWQRIDDVKEQMLNFLENHDELRLASRFLCDNPEKALPALVVSATLTTAPFMLYAGQETGEKAEGATGFSGDDGRTSIFDYINVPSLCRWYDHGNCNVMKLNNSERRLRAFYRKVLHIARDKKAIACGQLFDLMYVNSYNLDSWRHFVYLRHYEDETMLIGVNFADTDAQISINIPQHAFDFLGITPGRVFMKDLLSGKSKHVPFTATHKVALEIPAHNAVIFQLTF